MFSKSLNSKASKFYSSYNGEHIDVNFSNIISFTYSSSIIWYN